MVTPAMILPHLEQAKVKIKFMKETVRFKSYFLTKDKISLIIGNYREQKLITK